MIIRRIGRFGSSPSRSSKRTAKNVSDATVSRPHLAVAVQAAMICVSIGSIVAACGHGLYERS